MLDIRMRARGIKRIRRRVAVDPVKIIGIGWGNWPNKQPKSVWLQSKRSQIKKRVILFLYRETVRETM
jgi:hypothetical protein